MAAEKQYVDLNTVSMNFSGTKGFSGAGSMPDDGALMLKFDGCFAHVKEGGNPSNPADLVGGIRVIFPSGYKHHHYLNLLTPAVIAASAGKADKYEGFFKLALFACGFGQTPESKAWVDTLKGDGITLGWIDQAIRGSGDGYISAYWLNVPDTIPRTEGDRLFGDLNLLTREEYGRAVKGELVMKWKGKSGGTSANIPGAAGNHPAGPPAPPAGAPPSGPPQPPAPASTYAPTPPQTAPGAPPAAPSPGNVAAGFAPPPPPPAPR